MNGEKIRKIRDFVYSTCSYNPATKTEILLNRKCKLFSVGKICALTKEYITTYTREVADASPYPNAEIAIALITIASNLPGYARAGGGAITAIASSYLTHDEVESQIDFITCRAETFWTEPFFRAGLVIKDLSPDESVKFIEHEVEEIISTCEFEVMWID
jgi:hypothetical protein